MPGEVKKLTGFVGFANLPNQVHRKSIKQGFQFTLLVVGESGLGKATFINSLFNTQIYPKKTPKPPTKDPSPGVQIQTYTADLEEGVARLKLTVLDASGFGDSLDNSQSWEPIIKTIEERFDSFLEQERRVNRRNLVDNRIHCCIYFIPPTGHTLRALDIECMKNLHDKVNIIPVIAKADTLSEDEKAAFKKRILQDLEFNKINVYDIDIDPEDDEESKTRDRELRVAFPFAVVGSDKEYEVNGKKVRARKYPWGLLEIENEQHSDFIKFRNLLIKTRMEDLRFKTNEILYENYRTEKLMNGTGGKKGDNVLDAFEEEKKQHEAKMKKMEKEMKQVFEQKVNDKETRLKQSENQLHTDHQEKKSQLEKQLKELQQERKNLEESLKQPEKKTKKSGIF